MLSIAVEVLLCAKGCGQKDTWFLIQLLLKGVVFSFLFCGQKSLIASQQINTRQEVSVVDDMQN